MQLFLSESLGNGKLPLLQGFQGFLHQIFEKAWLWQVSINDTVINRMRGFVKQQVNGSVSATTKVVREYGK